MKNYLFIRGQAMTFLNWVRIANISEIPRVKRLFLSMIIISAVFIALFAGNNRAEASNTVVVGPELKSINLGPELDLLEDPGGKLSIDQVASPPLTTQFHSNRASKFTIGATTSAWWVRFKMTAIEREILLRATKPNLDQVDVYIPTSGGQIKYITGDQRPPGGKPIRSRTFVFPVPADYIAGQYIYVRLKSHTSLNLKLQLWSYPAWSNRASLELVIFGLLLGGILIMAIYNFFIYITFEDVTYLYYVLFMATNVLFLTRLFGLSSILIELPTGLTIPLTWLLLGTSYIGSALFSRSFLNSRSMTPRLDKVFLAFAVGAVLVVILGLTKRYHMANTLSHVLSSSAPFAYLTAGTVCFRKGFSAARYYLLAWSMFLGSLLLFVMGGVIIPSTFFTFHAVLLGSVLQAIFLSFALVDRIREVRRERAQLREQKRRLIELSTTDELTGLYNKRWYSSKLSGEIDHSHRLGLPLSLIMIDVDHFKKFNDSHGHATGDTVLAELGRVIINTTRETDIPCRYGGEEFAVILPGSDLKNTLVIAERLRLNFCACRFATPQHGKIGASISLGVSQLTVDDNEGTLFERTDRALYQAKSLGRNRVVNL
jgi:diguanylate cyclase (GGDEF)-like protein